ncbi:hypothetical protein [Thermus caldilimi]|uniref:hypothetical protein n=1 Tax=Thermus caldilimi TaxID=2483360 RepID=UPI001F0ECFA0|nr:hypothetical protein [Thermus caldilimi]
MTFFRLWVVVLAIGSLAWAAGGGWVRPPMRVTAKVELVPYGTTVLRFGEEVRYVATGWPYVQVAVLEGTLVLLRPLVREGQGELWIMLRDGREYRLEVVVADKTLAKTYRFR